MNSLVWWSLTLKSVDSMKLLQFLFPGYSHVAMEPPDPRPLGPQTSPTSPAPPLSSPPNVPPSPLSTIPSSSLSRRRTVGDFDMMSRKATSPGSPPSPKPKEKPIMCGSSRTMIIAQKRRLLEAENEGVSPQKKAKTLLTSVSM